MPACDVTLLHTGTPTVNFRYLFYKPCLPGDLKMDCSAKVCPWVTDDSG
jgi:hypothetical protein